MPIFAAPTAPPLSVEASVFNSSAVSLSWRPPSLNSQNGIIVKYIIRLLERATENIHNITTNGPHTEIFITSLHPHYLYEFSVAAQTVDIGPYSSASIVKTDEDSKYIR